MYLFMPLYKVGMHHLVFALIRTKWYDRNLKTIIKLTIAITTTTNTTTTWFYLQFLVHNWKTQNFNYHALSAQIKVNL